MPAEDPDHPELIPTENVDPTDDGKSAETGTKAAEHYSAPHAEIPRPDPEATAIVNETSRTVTWETYLATARIRTKDELLADLEDIETPEALRSWGADYFHTISNLPAIQNFYEIVGSTPNMHFDYYKEYFDNYAVESGRAASLWTIKNWIRNSCFPEILKQNPFNIHFTLEINEATKPKLIKIALAAKMKPEDQQRLPIGNILQNEINFLEFLYKEQDEEPDPEAWLAATNLSILRYSESSREMASLCRIHNIPITDAAILAEVEPTEFDDIKRLTEDERYILSYIRTLPDLHYSRKVLKGSLELIRKLQRCNGLTLKSL